MTVYLTIKKLFLVTIYRILSYLNVKIDARIWVTLDTLNSNYEKKEVKKWKIKQS